MHNFINSLVLASLYTTVGSDMDRSKQNHPAKEGAKGGILMKLLYCLGELG